MAQIDLKNISWLGQSAAKIYLFEGGDKALVADFTEGNPSLSLNDEEGVTGKWEGKEVLKTDGLEVPVTSSATFNVTCQVVEGRRLEVWSILEGQGATPEVVDNLAKLEGGKMVAPVVWSVMFLQIVNGRKTYLILPNATVENEEMPPFKQGEKSYPLTFKGKAVGLHPHFVAYQETGA